MKNVIQTINTNAIRKTLMINAMQIDPPQLSHYLGCEEEHYRCAIVALCDTLDGYREWVEEQQDVINKLRDELRELRQSQE